MLEEVIGAEQGARVLRAEVPVIGKSCQQTGFAFGLELLRDLGHGFGGGNDDGWPVGRGEVVHHEVCRWSDGGREHDSGARVKAGEQDDEGIEGA